MSASFSAPRLRPRQLSAGDLVEESLLDPANDYLRIVRARQPGAWTCGNGSLPPAQGCATACCGMAASCFVASR
ncbi:hypothetical protein AAAC13_26585 [Pseudomonas aeruginosa]